MKFLVDAQLLRRLALWFQQRGHDVIHTIELIQQNRTPDPLLLAMANQDDRALVTKDTDFEITHELGQGPPKLLLSAWGGVAFPARRGEFRSRSMACKLRVHC